MPVIIAIVLVVLIAHWTDLGTWTVLFGLLGLFISYVAYIALSRSRAEPQRYIRLPLSHGRTRSSRSKELVRRSEVQYQELVSSPMSITSGLIIRSDPLDQILAGSKIWEMRTGVTRKRERIALIQKGAKTIQGVADIVDCIGPLTDEDMVANADKHLIDRARLRDPAVAKYRYAWVLAGARRLRQPVSCPMKSGQQMFISIAPETADEIQRFL